MAKKIWRVTYDSSDRAVTMSIFLTAGSCDKAARSGLVKAKQAEEANCRVVVVGVDYVGDLV